jgi:hypothetical protein
MSDRCAHCDDRIPSEKWHPVATVRDDEGAVEIHDFCSEPCRAAWQSERAVEE